MIMDTFYYETITPYRLPFNQPVYCLQIPLGKVIHKKYTYYTLISTTVSKRRFDLNTFGMEIAQFSLKLFLSYRYRC